METAIVTPQTQAFRELLSAKKPQLDALLEKYGATNPMLFGSVARGDATKASDIDILVQMDSSCGNVLLRASGLLEEARELFGVPVDIFPIQLLKRPISANALAEMVAL